MSATEAIAALDGLRPGQIRAVAMCLWAKDPPAFFRAVKAARTPVPVPELPAYTEPPGMAHCAPGDCTCGGHVDAAGVFHAAGAR